MRDFGLEAQVAAERHLEECYETLDSTLSAEGPETAGPFCGCLTCQVRETLHVAWPIIEEYVRAQA